MTIVTKEGFKSEELQILAAPRYYQEKLPSVKWKHVDGPMMTRRNHSIYWLTPLDRFMCWLGIWTLDDIEKRSFR